MLNILYDTIDSAKHDVEFHREISQMLGKKQDVTAADLDKYTYYKIFSVDDDGNEMEIETIRYR